MAGNPPDYDNVRWPGADGLRVPQEMAPSTLAVKKNNAIDIGTQGSGNSITLAPNQALSSELVITNTVSSTTAATVNWPAAFPGLIFVAYNNTASGCTFKVTGKTGVSVGSGKRAVLVCETTDIARAAADA